MSPQRSFAYRVGAGKAIGFAFGILGFVLLPYFISEPSLLLRTAILLWYPTVGAVVGMFGAFAYHPVLNFPMPWWFRGALTGAWMNFVVTLFSYEQICTAVNLVMGEYGMYVSPFWMVLEGALIGMLMDYLLTRWFGEGWADKSED